jgi:hypothetical protein
MKGRRLLPFLLCAACSTSTVAYGQAKAYTPKNGVLNWKAMILGGGFRVTVAIPLHGDFSKYDRLEIVRAESLIGPDVPSGFLNQLTAQLASEFRRGGRFTDIAIVDSFEGPRPAVGEQSAPAPDTFRGADSLDAPMRSEEDLLAFDRQRRAAADVPESATLVVKSQVIDYTKGNKLLQLLLLDLGNGVLTMRFTYVDKVTSEELGSNVISSDNSSKVVPSLLSPRSAMSGVAEGLADQVTRRKVAGER